MTEDTKKGSSHINIKLDEKTAQGQYSNFAIINHGPDEFVIDFLFIQPGMPAAKVNSRVVLSPGHARRLLAALQNNVDKYEERHGPIQVTSPAIKVQMHPVDEGEIN